MRAVMPRAKSIAIKISMHRGIGTIAIEVITITEITMRMEDYPINMQLQLRKSVYDQDNS